MSACHLLVETTVFVLTHTEGLCVFVSTVTMEIYVKQVELSKVGIFLYSDLKKIYFYKKL